MGSLAKTRRILRAGTRVPRGVMSSRVRSEGRRTAVRGVGMGVAEAVALRMSGQGAAASIGELKLAAIVGG